MSLSSEGSPCGGQRVRSISDGDEVCVDERPERMRDWLIRMINSGRFPGLEWLDEEKTIFKVPWVHAKKRGYCRERDAALFREWALHSGKYRDESDPTVWKINFRCAINGLKDIKEIKDMQTEDCRVYRVFPSRSRRRRPRRRCPSAEPYPTGLSQCAYSAEGSHFQFSHVSAPYTAAAPGLPITACTSLSYSQNHLSDSPSHLTALPTVPKMEYKPLCSVSGSPPPVSPQPQMAPYHCISGSPTATDSSSPPPHYSCIASTGSTGSNEHINEVGSYYASPLPPVSTIHHDLALRRQGSPDSLDSGIMEPQNSPPASILQNELQQAYAPPTLATAMMSMPSSTVASNPVLNNNNSEIVDLVEELEKTHSPSPSLPPSPCPRELNVRILYGSIPVFTESIYCDKGARIFFDPHFPGSLDRMDEQRARTLFGPAEVHPIQLPVRHPNPLANELFKAMFRGLVLEVIGNDIYATPLCRAVVYYGHSATHQSQHLEKDQRTKVFDYTNDFRPALERYALFQGAAPAPYVVFSLGQSWGPGRHVAQNLISIVVTHTLAKHELDTIGLPQALARDLLTDIPETVEIQKANMHDIEAETFLSQYVSLS